MPKKSRLLDTSVNKTKIPALMEFIYIPSKGTNNKQVMKITWTIEKGIGRVDKAGQAGCNKWNGQGGSTEMVKSEQRFEGS